MKIFNVRHGFACNSSSTHSIVLIPKGRPIPDGVAPQGTDFGWDNFVLTDEDSKMRYLASLLSYRLKDAQVVFPQLFGKTLDDFKVGDELPSIDHESAFSIPEHKGGPDLAFAQELVAFFKRSDVVILGGNDNDEEGHPLNVEQYPSALNWAEIGRYNYYGDRSRVRKDPQGFWAIFQPSSGLKVRGSFEEGALDPGFSMLPELVDVKITDQCAFGCAYCYQGSTPQGKHASLDDVKYVLEQLATMQVFEVAFGGGEPLEHPDFWKMVDVCVELGIVPNFTTRRPDLLDHAYAHKVGCVAFSTQSPKEVDTIMGAFPKERRQGRWRYGHEEGLWRYTHQHILGMSTREQYQKYLTSLKIHDVGDLTLLGYKPQQRGSLLRPTEAAWAIEDFKAFGTPWGRLAVDTKFAQMYPHVLEEAKIDRKLYYTTEGAHSMYVDVVTKQAGPSSYHPEYMREYSTYGTSLHRLFREMPTRLVGDSVEYGRLKVGTENGEIYS